MLVSIITTRIMVLDKDPMICIYIYIHTQEIHSNLDSISERDASKKETFEENIFQDWECAIFFDIKGCLIFPSVNKSSCSSWLGPGRRLQKMSLSILDSQIAHWKLNWLTSLGCSRYIYCLSQIVVFSRECLNPLQFFSQLIKYFEAISFMVILGKPPDYV